MWRIFRFLTLLSCKLKCLLKVAVISHFPKKYDCSKYRLHNGAVLLQLIFEQAEPAFFVNLLTVGHSKQPNQRKGVPQKFRAEHTLTHDFTFGPPFIEMSQF